MTSHSWPLLNILKENSDVKLGVVILNMPLEGQYNLLKLLWNKAVVKISVDGGCNKLFRFNSDQSESFVPDVVSGDFDSITPDVLQFFRERGAECVTTMDQDYTDFTKCFQLLKEKKDKFKVDCVVVLGGFGGRMDQVFANLNTLFDAKTLLPGIQVYLLSEENLVCLLPKGDHVLQMDSGIEGDWCGLIPIDGACHHVTTTGLKWNLDNQPLKFGQLVSTSNKCLDTTVTVATDNYLLWTTGVNLAGI